MKEVVSDPDYYDRGMWGPMGGQGCTPSQPFMDEHDRIHGGGPSELSLMTVVTPDGQAMTLAEHQQKVEAEQEADRRATEAMMQTMAEDDAARTTGPATHPANPVKLS